MQFTHAQLYKCLSMLIGFFQFLKLFHNLFYQDHFVDTLVVRSLCEDRLSYFMFNVVKLNKKQNPSFNYSKTIRVLSNGFPTTSTIHM